MIDVIGCVDSNVDRDEQAVWEAAGKRRSS